MKAENWILLLTYDNLDLTKAAIDTFRAQDIEGGVEILVVDNGSSDNTRQWLHTQPDLNVIFHDTNSVSGGWNTGLRWLFNTYWKEGKPAPSRAQQVLVCNNDVLLRPDTYRWLVEDGGGFVTSVGDDSPSSINPPYKPPTASNRPHPDFSCYLIHQWVWQKVGEFDENFKIAFGETGICIAGSTRQGSPQSALICPSTIRDQPPLPMGAQNSSSEFSRRPTSTASISSRSGVWLVAVPSIMPISPS